MMDTMMLKMKMVLVTSVPDLDFMEQMIPHHQGAIAMAEYEIKNGKNREMIQLAKSITAEQANDIQIMKLLISRLPALSKKAGKSFTDAMEKSMKNMMKNMPFSSKLIDADKALAFVMIPHHQAGIEMAVALIKEAASEQVATFAKQLISQKEFCFQVLCLIKLFLIRLAIFYHPRQRG
jgi:uncharacterized protein (DUF305 family)